MAQVNIDVAKEESVQAVNTKVGTSSDTASNTPTTVFAGIKGLISWFTSVWTAARATKLDSIQTTLNTPDGNTLGAWLNYLQTTSQSSINLLNNATYGLNAIKTALSSNSEIFYKSSNNIKSVQLNSQLSAQGAGDFTVICNFFPKATGNVKITLNVFVAGGTIFRLGNLVNFPSGNYPNSTCFHPFYNSPVGTTFNVTYGNITVPYSLSTIFVTDSIWLNGYTLTVPVIKNIPIVLGLLGSYGGYCNYCAISYDEVN